MKKIFLLVLALALTACSAGRQSELDRNRVKWEAANIQSYHMSLFVGCFCAYTTRMPLEIEVRDGKLASMTWSDGEPVPQTDIEYPFFLEYATIDGMFQQLKSGDASQADELKVQYDPTHGYPLQIDVDPIKNAKDDEYHLTVSNFQASK